MSKINVPLLRFNQGLISPESLARVDDPRTQLSAERYENWIPKTQGSMKMRPGTQYFGATKANNPAYFIEFVAAADQLALIELTDGVMRVWTGDDAHSMAILSRPQVASTISFDDTGWVEDHIGGGITPLNPTSGGSPLIPVMGSNNDNGIVLDDNSILDFADFEWHAADNNENTQWESLTAGSTARWQIDFGAARQVKTVSIQAPQANTEAAPKTWSLEGSADTGFATLETFISVDTGEPWSAGETRTFEDTGYSDTGSTAYRYWRFATTNTFDTGSSGGSITRVAQYQMFGAGDTGQANFFGGQLTLNAGARGSVARVKRRVVVSGADAGVEHSLAINVSRGPVFIRIGSTEGTDDLVSETALRTGRHSLAFIPTGTFFHVTLKTEEELDRIVGSISVGDSGVVELAAPYDTGDLTNIRFDQSADVTFVAAKDKKQQRIERRGNGSSIGRSWSIVDYDSDFGPFRPISDSTVKMNLLDYRGNTTLNADRPFFDGGHTDAVFRLTHTGQSGVERLGNLDSATEAVSVTGVEENDTGTNSAQNERRITFATSGTWAGTFIIERSFESKDFGFSQVSSDFVTSGNATDTGTATVVIDDPDSNSTVWYRAKISQYTSGTAVVTITAPRSVRSGVVRITNVDSNLSASCEVLRRPSDTGTTTDWEEGSWSSFRGYPTSVALHEGRLAWAGEANIWMSVSDDYENFDDDVDGASAPIARTFGAGPVQNILNLTSADLLLATTADAEMVVRSSSFDEVLTATNTAARRASTLGSANVRSIIRNKDVFFVQRSGKNLFRMLASNRAEDVEPLDITILAPDVLESGVTSIAIQREPDTRIHCVLADGTVAILTYEPNENMLAWSKWRGDTGTSASVEEAVVLPGLVEDGVYYLIKRTINGSTVRYLEKWALESETAGDTGLTYLSDCSVSYTDTGRTATLTGFSHLAGTSVVVWADDTGQAKAGKDLSPDVEQVQTEYAVDTGAGTITLSEDVHHAVAGLPYTATWKSTKLAYGARAGTALTMMKRVDELGIVLFETHNRAIYHGRDTGNLDPLPLYIDEGSQVDADKIFNDVEIRHVPFPGLWDSDSRVVLQAKSPRPATILAAVPNMKTNDRG